MKIKKIFDYLTTPQHPPPPPPPPLLVESKLPIYTEKIKMKRILVALLAALTVVHCDFDVKVKIAVDST